MKRVERRGTIGSQQASTSQVIPSSSSSNIVRSPQRDQQTQDKGKSTQRVEADKDSAPSGRQLAQATLASQGRSPPQTIAVLSSPEIDTLAGEEGEKSMDAGQLMQIDDDDAEGDADADGEADADLEVDLLDAVDAAEGRVKIPGEDEGDDDYDDDE